MTLAYAAAAWFLGTVAAALGWGPPWLVLAGVPPIAAAAAIARRSWQPAVLVALAGLLFSAGAWRLESSTPPARPSGIAVFNDTGVATTFRGVVDGEPDETERFFRVRLLIREVERDGGPEPTGGGVLVRARPGSDYRYGDLLEVTGRLETPPEFPGFNYRQYLARRGVVSLSTYPEITTLGGGHGNDAMEMIHALRRELSAALDNALPDTQAALAQGIILGKRSSLPDDLTDALNDTGTSHIVALSGYNVMIIAGMVIGGLAWIAGRRNAAILALLAIAAYTVFTGASPSLVRAAIMGSLYLLASLVGRPNSGIISLLLAAAIMTGPEPSIVQDVSFQLSFAAAAGLIILTPLLRDRAAGLLLPVVRGPERLHRGPIGGLLEISLTTIAATAATLPFIALHFQRLSLVALPANLLVLPVFPFIMLASALTAAAGLVAAWLATPFAWAAWAGLTYMIELVRLLAGLPFAAVELRGFEMGHAVALYGVLGAVAWALARNRPGKRIVRRAWRAFVAATDLATYPLRPVPVFVAAPVLAAATALAWWAALDTADGRLRMTMLDVGQGDAILVQTPGGHDILIDGGPDGDTIRGALDDRLEPGDNGIEMVVLTHPHEDHVAGLLAVLRDYEVDQVVTGPAVSSTETYDAWLDLIDQKDIPRTEIEEGVWVDLGNGVTLTVLSPPSDTTPSHESANDDSLVLRIVWGDVSFLLMGDVESAGESRLLDLGATPPSTVLKVGHHGAAGSSGEAFLDAVDPDVSLISVGEPNRFDHPAAKTLERLAGTLIYRTDRHGWVSISTDGYRLWVRTERPQPPTPPD